MTVTVATDVRRVVMRHVRHLAEGIGPRLPGTARNRAAAHYIEKSLRTAGLTVEQEVFAFPDWEDLGTTLTIGGRDIAALTNTFSPPCRLRARLRPVGTLDELITADDLRRSILVLYGELARGPLPTKAAVASGEFSFGTERDRVVKAVEAAQPAAVLTVSPRRFTIDRLIVDPDLDVPSATVPPDAGLDLVRHAGAPADLTIRSSRRAGTAANVVGRGPLPGPPVIVCAHFDTKTDGPGAFDNASGVAVLLAAAGLLAAELPDVPVEYLACNGEEYWGLGVLDYVARHGASPDTVRGVVNVDGVGQLLGTTAVAPIGCQAPLAGAVTEAAARYGGVVVSEPWLHSDHYSFAVRGIPCVAVTAHGVVDVSHGPDDAVGWLDADRLVETVHLLRDLVAVLAVDR